MNQNNRNEEGNLARPWEFSKTQKLCVIEKYSQKRALNFLYPKGAGPGAFNLCKHLKFRWI